MTNLKKGYGGRFIPQLPPLGTLLPIFANDSAVPKNVVSLKVIKKQPKSRLLGTPYLTGMVGHCNIVVNVTSLVNRLKKHVLQIFF